MQEKIKAPQCTGTFGHVLGSGKVGRMWWFMASLQALDSDKGGGNKLRELGHGRGDTPR